MGRIRRQVLDRQGTPERLVEGAVHDAHAARAETLLDPVAADLQRKIEPIFTLRRIHAWILAQAAKNVFAVPRPPHEHSHRFVAKRFAQIRGGSGSRKGGSAGPAPPRCQRSDADREIRGHPMGQLHGRQSDGAVVGQTLSSDHPPPAIFPSSGLFSRMSVSLERESFFVSFFFMGCFPLRSTIIFEKP